jgi:hypothetical protein
VILGVGNRADDSTTVYLSSELARHHGAGGETETTSSAEADAPFGEWRLEPPERWDELPWATSRAPGEEPPGWSAPG